MLNNEILACLKSPDKLSQIRQECEDQEVTDELFNGIKATCETIITDAGLQDIVTGLLAGDSNLKLSEEEGAKEAFSNAQELAMKFYDGEWNIESANLAICIYIESGHSVEIEKEEDTEVREEFPTLGDLYGLGEDDPEHSVEAKLSTADRKKLPGASFCGPNRSFPVHDKAHVTAALRLLGRYKGPGEKGRIRSCIMRKASKLGMGSKEENTVVFYPFIIKNGQEEYYPIEIDSVATLNSILENKQVISEEYCLNEEQVTQLDNLLKELSNLAGAAFAEDFKAAPLFESVDQNTGPVEIGTEFLFKYFIKRESSEDEKRFLAPLVGIIRSKNLTQEEVTKAYEAYSKFGPSILELFLKNTPEKTEQPETPDLVENVVNPAATTVTKVEGSSKENNTKKQSLANLWKSPRSKRNIKENK